MTDLIGTWRCDDGGTYYITATEDQVFWFGEHPTGRFANVFVGRARLDSTLEGVWFDVPKGRTTAYGRDMLLREESPGRLHRVTGDGFGGSVWVRDDLAGLASSAFRQAGFQGTGPENRTG